MSYCMNEILTPLLRPGSLTYLAGRPGMGRWAASVWKRRKNTMRNRRECHDLF